MKKAISFLMVIVILGFAACSQPISAGILQSEKARVTEPPVSQGDLATLVDGNSEFAFDLYQTLKDIDGNLFYSPYSISLALAMTFAGTRGETEQQMADTVNFLLPQGFSTYNV